MAFDKDKSAEPTDAKKLKELHAEHLAACEVHPGAFHECATPGCLNYFMGKHDVPYCGPCRGLK